MKGFSTAAVSDCWSDWAYLTVTSPIHTLLHHLCMSCLDTELYHASLLPMQCIISGVCTTCACAWNHNHRHELLCSKCADADGHLLTPASLHSNCPCTATALQMAYLLGYDSLLRGGYPVRPNCTSAHVRPTLSSVYSLYCVCSGPLVKNGAEHINCLHKSYSLPGEIKLPGQDASPPVKVPKGMRSNRLRRQGPNAATALGVKKTGGTRVAKSSSTVQDEFIKVCPHHHHQVTI